MIRPLREFLSRLLVKRERWIPPTESPVPWISDAVWVDWSRRPVPNYKPLADGNESPIGDAVVGEVSTDDRQRAPRRCLQGDERMAPEGLLADHEQLLRSTPPAFGVVYGPLWPVCCHRLTTIIHCEGAGESLEEIERVVGCLDFAFVEANSGDMQLTPEQDAELRARGYADLLNEIRRDRGGDGYGILECRKCGRTYVTIWEP